VIGIVAGTYSSIYISAALALDLGLRTDDLLERKHTKPEEVDGLP
jgi:preprotein translocase subunit SecF